ncbi:MAG: hypothetical protein GEU74_01430 [Nitriliruptorales bacterium]|nr:hypothetical protein [Nitriliruptorales bacterium]
MVRHVDVGTGNRSQGCVVIHDLDPFHARRSAIDVTAGWHEACGTPRQSHRQLGKADVFDVGRRPWVTVDGAETDRVVATVVQCPTGALRYTRLDGGAQEDTDDITTVVPVPNGPLFVRGKIRVTTPDGTLVADETRVALCRCGSSANAPFCDNSHRAAGFRSSDPQAVVPVAAGGDPGSPAEVCEPQDF